MVTCEYCGAVTRVTDQPSTPPPNAQVPPPSATPVALQIGHLDNAAATGIKAASIIGLVVSLIVPLGIGLAIYFAAHKSREASRQRLRAAKEQAEALRRKTKARLGLNLSHREDGSAPVSGSGICLVRANQDKIADIAILMGKGSGGNRSDLKVHFFNGLTGQHLGESPSLGTLTRAKLICLGGRHVGVDGADLKLRVVTAHTPHKVITVLLDDRVSKVAATDECAKVETDDGTVKQFRLETGETTKCRAGPMLRLARRPGMPWFKGVRTFKAGRVRYRVEAKRHGILTVSARQGREILWKETLDIAASHYGIPAVLTANSLVLVGAAYPDKDHAVMAGLALSTGRKRYAVPLRGRSIASFGVAIQYNGRWVILWHRYTVTAFDPDTGKLVWRLQ